jgi:hypothetical protein
MVDDEPPTEAAPDGGELTELRGIAEAETESAYAWGLCDDLELGEDTRRRRVTPIWITAAAVSASLVVTAAAAVFAYHQWHATSAVAIAPPASTVLRTVVTASSPDIGPHACSHTCSPDDPSCSTGGGSPDSFG